ncbi:MAG TPA: PDZ domain-containing protein [Vicinamibacterales bacterium]|nr:PDZ domain-containing protein [Vicinamibacterales bacterium]
MVRPLASVLVVLGAVAASAYQGSSTAGADAAFAQFFEARTAAEAMTASEQIVASGLSVDDVLARLKRGRSYSDTVPRGVVQASYLAGTTEYFYTLDVPESYDATRRYQVRLQLHGGVGRITGSAPPRTGASARLAGAEQIYVMPYAWRDAPWWSRRQTGNLGAILDRVKRTYNVDENRVVLSGVSDGGTGVYFTAMRDTTPYASFLPLNGFMLVLRNEMADAEGDLFPNNLRNKPLFIVNGGRDPQYPASEVGPYVEHLAKNGVDVTYRPQPEAAHDTSWWPEVKDGFERFVAEHPRQPLPDTLTWESGDVPGRAHWLVIDRLESRPSEETALPDVNRRASAPAVDFGLHGSGPRVTRVMRGSNAQQIGLQSGDMIAAINNQPTTEGTDVADLLRGVPPGRPLIFSVVRGGQPIRLTGRYAPTVIPGESEWIFPPQGGSGRVDLVRRGNRVDATTRGVGAFRLLLSPDQFDLTQPITVVVNGQTAFEGVVRKDVRTLLAWAAKDNDRTMLFAAELPVRVP